MHWIERLLDRPAVAHALSAYERYSSRLGPQFAAGIAYYSILSMVPILMLCFAALGMTLTIIRPDLMDVVQDQIEALISDVNLSKSISDLITGAMRQWASTLGVGIITGSYAGSRWAGNLKRAVRVMWSREFEDAAERKHFFVELALNLVIFLGLVVSVVFSIGVATIGTAFSRNALEFLGWTHIPGIDTLFVLLSIALTLLASWILMAFLFIALPNQPARPWPWLVGTLLGAVALTVLQQLAGLLMGLLGFNSAASVFGPVIVLMIMLYILATTIMLAAAWVGSATEWRAARQRRIDERGEKARREREPVAPVAPAPQPEPEAAPLDDRLAARLSLDELRDADTALPTPARRGYVRQSVAARGMRFNLGLGYGVGAATGLGLGALIVSAARRLTGRGSQ